MKSTDRRQFLQMLGMSAVAGSLGGNIEKALAIPANHRTGTIQDVEHIVILMQENRPFDHHFGTLRGVRGFADPRAVKIHLPLQGGGTAPASVFLQPAGAANVAAGYGVPPESGDLGGPADGVPVIPPFRIDPAKVPEPKGPGMTYLPGTGHGWSDTHRCWNSGKYDQWAITHGPIAMSYMTRDDIPYHCALADAFTVLDNYYCSVMGPTNPNRCYMWTGSIGNVDYLGAAGTDGKGAGPITYNGLSVNSAYLAWETFPEVLQTAGVSWKIYQDVGGSTFAPDFGGGGPTAFAGNFGDNSVLYFSQYANATPCNPLFDNGCTGTTISHDMPTASAPAKDWAAWAERLFDEFRSDVAGGRLPQVSWICAPAGYTEHSDWPINYGAWYISKVLDILVAHPEVFGKTVFIVNYDEADGSFDHLVPPSPPASTDGGASTIDFHNEIVTTSTPNGPIGLGTRVPCIVISPWSKGGYVNSQVFDHTSTIQFIEKRFGVHERNISAWRRAVAGDLTSVFNFKNPNDTRPRLPSTSAYLPTDGELAGGPTTTFIPTLDDVLVGIPGQEKGVRAARALPYELDAHGSAHHESGAFRLRFSNTGRAAAVFNVRSGNPVDPVWTYTVEAGKTLSGSWKVSGRYDLSVYGPNGFARYFKGRLSNHAAALRVRAHYGNHGDGSITLKVHNVAVSGAHVSIMDAYSGHSITLHLRPGEATDHEVQLGRFNGWYDLVVTVDEDPAFEYRLAGHVETGRDSTSDPAMGGLVTLKG
jgi:phospholipase C